MATASATYQKHLNFFQAGGQYHDYADMLGAYDHLSLTATVSGAVIGTRAFYLSNLPTQTTQRLALGAETFHDVALAAKGASRLAAGVGIVSIGIDVAYLAHYGVERDGAGALLSIGNIGYGAAGLLIGGPIGIAFGSAQLGVNGALYLYQRHQDGINRQNLRRSAQSSQDAMNSARQVGEKLAAEMAEKGCK